MSAKHVIGSLLLLAPVALGAQDAKKTEVSGEFSVEGRKVDVDSKSSKYNEYSDANNGFPIYKLGIEVLTPKGSYIDLKGENLLRDDQSIRLSTGKFGLWNLVAERNETPHHLSFKAMTPFRNRGNGLFTLDSVAPIPNRVLAPTAAQLLPNDAATAAWLLNEIRPTELGTQRDKTGATLTLTPTERLKLRLSFSDERKEGSKIGYGVIGDRPPRSLAAQMAQPIDFKSTELKLEAEYNKPRYQALLTYAVSKFENNIDTFRWQNPYALGTGTYDQWSGHRVATFGQSPLAPDNTYQNATFSLGVNLPWSSRLNVSAAMGKMTQDKALLPYATSSFGSTTVDFSSTAVLPRPNADAEIETKRINLDYSINPLSRLQLRAYFQMHDLENNTPVSNWWYVTSDTMPGSATATVTNPTYVNKRRSVHFSTKQNLTGLEATTYLSFWRTSLAFGVEQEDIDRTEREAHTTKETILKASFRARPTNWLSLRGKVLAGNRDGGKYENEVTRETYWYDITVAQSDNNNPGVSFNNHPDTRKFDVSDRKRNQVELSAILTPVEALSIAFSYRDRKDDFDSNVKPVQPLLDVALVTNLADKNATTPGAQVGLLKNDSQRFALDVSYAISERFTLNAFASRDKLDLSQRGIEFNENNRLNPSAVSGTNELGSWTRATSLWMANSKDATDTYGLGASFEIIPGKLRFSTDYAYSNGTVDITYSGFGTQSSVNPANILPDTNEYAFRTPSTVRNKQTTLNANLHYQVSKSLKVGLHYALDRYDLKDWMQEANTPWFGSVGSEYLLRDSSSATSTQWGNRLISLGSYLAPTYDAHYVSLSVNYRF